MFRLLIVDDEKFIADNLAMIIEDYEGVDLDILKAYSAEDALTLLKKTRIDIVMTDICMPDLDGITLQKRILEYSPKCKVIFLTGYNDFQYIQSAIRQEAVDYVLKTEKIERIYAALKKALASIKKDVENESFVLGVKKKMDAARHILQKEFLTGFLLQSDEDSEQEFIENLKELEIPLNPNLPLMLLLQRVDSWEGYKKVAQKNEVMCKIHGIVAEYANGNADIFSIIYEKDRQISFIQPLSAIDEKSLQRLKNHLYDMMDAIQDTCREITGVPVSFAIGKDFTGWKEAQVSFAELSTMMARGIGLGSGIIVTHEMNASIIESEQDRSKLLSEIYFQIKKMETLRESMEKGRVGEFKAIFCDMMKYFTSTRELPQEIVLEVFYSFSSMFLSFINRFNLTRDIRAGIDLQKLAAYDKFSSWMEISDYFLSVADFIFSKRKSEFDNSMADITEKVNLYIQQHLNEDLSLDKIADLMLLRSYHLSRLYKQATGKGLARYIAEMKIDKAKELLLQSDKKIHEIADSMGFGSPQYFTRFFRKFTGLSPQEYKDMNMANN